MSVGARILERNLVVVACLQQAWRPRVVTVLAVDLALIGFPVGIGVDEEVGIATAVVEDARPGSFAAVGLHGLVEHIPESIDLELDALGDIPVAVIIDLGTLHPNVDQVLSTGHIGVARAAAFHLDF